MYEKNYRLDMGKLTDNLTDEQQAQITNFLNKAQTRKRKDMPAKQAFRVGVVITAICGLALLFCLYLLILGGKAEGVCTKSRRESDHHYDVYTYTVDGEECWVKINVTSKRTKNRLGETRTIHYLPAQPMIAYDHNLLALALIGLPIGVLFLYGARKSKSKDDSGLPEGF